MTLSRREFTALVGAGAIGLPAQGERLTTERVGEMLDALGGRGVFANPEWLEMLREAIERTEGMTATIRGYAHSSDAEPSILFARY